jgi:hypothetical protein
MSIIYKTCTEDGVIPEHICNSCDMLEHGRVSGSAYINKILKYDLTKQNVESLAWWEQQIEAGLIFINPNMRGTFDGGAKNTISGFGREKEKTTGKTFTAVVNDSNHSNNEAFYEGLENNYRDYIFAFCTENELRIGSDVINGLEVKDSIEEDTDSIVLWQATITWFQYKPKMLVSIYQLTDELKDLFSKCINEIVNP